MCLVYIYIHILLCTLICKQSQASSSSEVFLLVCLLVDILQDLPNEYFATEKRISALKEQHILVLMAPDKRKEIVIREWPLGDSHANDLSSPSRSPDWLSFQFDLGVEHVTCPNDLYDILLGQKLLDWETQKPLSSS